MVQTLLSTLAGTNETAVFLDKDRCRAILRAAFVAHYAPQSGREVVFDTNRVRTARLPLLRALYPCAR
jgi:sulfotransferase